MGEEAPATAEIIKLGEAMERILVDSETGLAVPRSMQDQVAMAAYAVKSGLLPDSIRTTAQAWMVMQRGNELGFPGLTAFEFLYPVNGKVRLTPDGAKAKALASGLLLDYREEVEGDGEAMLGRVVIRRKGIPTPISYEFSITDAKTAGLYPGEPKSAWRKYPKRMLLARARGYAFGDAFRDIVGGLQVREVADLDPGEAVSAEPRGRSAAQPTVPAPPEPDPLLDELGGAKTQAAEDAVVVDAPFASHAEADAAIVEALQAEESKG